jgi:hypothetical protein
MYYRTREGEITAADTYTSLSGLYGKSTTASIQVMANVSRIVGAMVSVATDSATNAAASISVSLSGDGLSQGSETFTVASAGVVGTETSNGVTVAAIQIPLDIPVIASNQVSVEGVTNADTGTLTMAVTLVFA